MSRLSSRALGLVLAACWSSHPAPDGEPDDRADRDGQDEQDPAEADPPEIAGRDPGGDPWEHLCEPCVGFADDCGGPPNLCIYYTSGGDEGVCGTDCAGMGGCPTGFGCVNVMDGVGHDVGYVCLPEPLGSPCVR